MLPNLYTAGYNQPIYISSVEPEPMARTQRGLSLLSTPSSALNPWLLNRADPWVTRQGNRYWYCYADGRSSIYLAQADSLEGLADARSIRVWKAPRGEAYSLETWAPELHFLDGRCYIYFAASDGKNENHRMFVLESASDEAFGPYHLRGPVSGTADRWAIDGTVFEADDGRRYFLWSGWAGKTNVQQNLYIAAMKNPWTLERRRILLSAPTETWERKGGGPYVNEGPQILRRGSALHIVYSASGSWCDDYCLGRLTFQGGDLLNPKNWEKVGPVFAKTDQIFGPGHACFVRSLDEQEDWIFYHVAQYKGAGWRRNVHRQLFTWNEADAPVFGTPLPLAAAGEESSSLVG